MFYSEGRVNVIIGVRVDGIVGDFTKDNSTSDKILADLRNRIDWGKRRLRKTTFAEKDAEQLETYDVRVGQEDYARSLTIPTIERNRASSPKASLTTSEETELRSMNGSLNWSAKETRIGLATPANLNQQGSKTVANLCEASRLIRDATKSADFKLTFLPTPVDQLWLTGLGDPSWANISEGRSQGGVLISYLRRTLHDDYWWTIVSSVLADGKFEATMSLDPVRRESVEPECRERPDLHTLITRRNRVTQLSRTQFANTTTDILVLNHSGDRLPKPSRSSCSRRQPEHRTGKANGNRHRSHSGSALRDDRVRYTRL